MIDAPRQENIDGNVHDVDCRSTTSSLRSKNSSLYYPIQQSMVDDFENLRPLEDICNLGHLPLFEGTHCAATQKPPMQRDVTDVPVEEIRPCCATWTIGEALIPGQAICGLFCGFPSCIGCVGQCTALCCMCKFVNCKMLDCKDEDSKCCACQQCNWFLTLPNKGFESQSQCCCIDYRFAGPCCTNKVPCLFACLGLTCCADWKCVGMKCMPRLGDVIPRLDERIGKSPTAEQAASTQNVTVTVNVAK